MTPTPPDNSEWIDELLLEIALGEKVEDIEPLDIRQLRVKRATDRIAHTEAKAQIIAKLREARIDELTKAFQADGGHDHKIENGKIVSYCSSIKFQDYYDERIAELNSPQGEEAGTV